MTIRTDNSAVIAHLDKRIAEIEAERDAAQQSRARLVGLVRFKNLEIKVLASDVKDLDTGNKELITELDAANKRAEQAEQRTKKQLNEIMELSKEHERLALIIDSNNLPDTAADLISQLRLEIVAEKDRAEQAEANLELLEAQRNLAEKERRVLEFKFSEMRERAEQLRTDARRLAHIAKNVRIVSESENNLIEKYAK